MVPLDIEKLLCMVTTRYILDMQIEWLLNFEIRLDAATCPNYYESSSSRRFER